MNAIGDLQLFGELQAFLGSVGPKIAVHAAVNRFAEFIEAGAPSVVPETAPIILLFEADDLRDVGALGGGGLEGPEKGGSGWTCTDDGNSLFHIGSLHLIFWMNERVFWTSSGGEDGSPY